MSKIVILENEYATLWFHIESKIVEHKIKKFIFGDTFRNLLLLGTETLQKNKGKKWLSDDRFVPVLLKEDLDWGNKYWIQQTIQVGWKYWAVIQPEGAFGRLNLDRLVDEYSKLGVISKNFVDRDEALKWLEEQT